MEKLVFPHSRESAKWRRSNLIDFKFLRISQASDQVSEQAAKLSMTVFYRRLRVPCNSRHVTPNCHDHLTPTPSLPPLPNFQAFGPTVHRLRRWQPHRIDFATGWNVACRFQWTLMLVKGSQFPNLLRVFVKCISDHIHEQSQGKRNVAPDLALIL